MKYSKTGPPSNIPDVAKIIHGEFSRIGSSLASACSIFVKYSESNGLSSVSKIFCLSSLARYSGYDSCIADASEIIPSVNTGASTISPDFI